MLRLLQVLQRYRVLIRRFFRNGTLCFRIGLSVIVCFLMRTQRFFFESFTFATHTNTPTLFDGANGKRRIPAKKSQTLWIFCDPLCLFVANSVPKLRDDVAAVDFESLF